MLWRQGYVCQRMDEKWIPIRQLFYEQNRDLLRILALWSAFMIRGREVKCKGWKCEAFGNAPLYQLDTFLPKTSINS
jgi:starch phosphorylase